MLEPDGTCGFFHQSLHFTDEKTGTEKERQHSEGESGLEFQFPLSTRLLLCSSSLDSVEVTNSSQMQTCGDLLLADFLKTNFLLKSLCSVLFLQAYGLAESSLSPPFLSQTCASSTQCY